MSKSNAYLIEFYYQKQQNNEVFNPVAEMAHLWDINYFCYLEQFSRLRVEIQRYVNTRKILW